MGDPQFPDILTWAIPFFLTCIGLELLRLKFHPVKDAYTFKDARTSLTMGIGMFLIDLVIKGFMIAFLFWVWQFRVIDLRTVMPLFAVVLLALFLDDFNYYIKHFIYHKSRWFWASHVVHHSSEHYNLTTALRQTWTGSLTGAIFLDATLVYLGMHPLVLVLVGAMNLMYQFWFHTETVDKCPRWFEFIFNTPSHHRVHHGRNPRYLDSNYGGILIIWDRLFGTFVPENPVDKVEYGIVSPLNSYNPFVVAFHEYIAIAKDVSQPGLGFVQRLKLIFAAPGTCFDDSKHTAQQIKASYVRSHPQQAGTPGFPEN